MGRCVKILPTFPSQEKILLNMSPPLPNGKVGEKFNGKKGYCCVAGRCRSPKNRLLAYINGQWKGLSLF